MTARLKGRRKQALAVVHAVSVWAGDQPDVSALALVGSYAYGSPGMASDVDLVLLSDAPERHLDGIEWVSAFEPRARLIRDQQWGPMRERRVRLRSGLHVELGVASPSWADTPLDPGTARVLQDGCQVLYDPAEILNRALASL